MSFKAMSSTVEQFCAVFYRMILENQSNFQQAAYAGRKYLQYHRSKSTRFGMQVSVADFIVPVIYTAQCDRSDFGYITENHVAALNQTSEFDVDRVDGREGDVLLLETYLLLVHNIGVIAGPAGIGKSAFMKHLCSWWSQTGLVGKSFWYSFSPHDPSSKTTSPLSALEKSLREDGIKQTGPDFTDDVIRYLRGNRCLICLDLFECAFEGFPDERQVFLQKFLRRLVGGKSLVLIASRRREKLGSVSSFQHSLGSIDLRSATKFAIDLLSVYDGSPRKFNATDSAYLERILKLAQGNPMAIQILLHDLSGRKLRPQAYFDLILAGNAIHIEEDWIFQSTDDSARSVIEIISLFSNLPPVLGMFWKIIPVKELPVFWLLLRYEMDHQKNSFPYANRLSSLLISAGKGVIPPKDHSLAQEACTNAINQLISAGFSQKQKARDNSGKNYYIIHPLVTIVLRSLPQFGHPDLLPAWKSAFIMFYGYISRDWPWHIPRMHANPEWEEYRPIIEQDILNLLTAANIQLETPFKGGSVAWPPSNIIAVLPKGLRADVSLIELLLDFWERALKRYLEKLRTDTTKSDDESYVEEILGLKDPTAKYDGLPLSSIDEDIQANVRALRYKVTLVSCLQALRFGDILYRQHKFLGTGKDKEYIEAYKWVKSVYEAELSSIELDGDSLLEAVTGDIKFMLRWSFKDTSELTDHNSKDIEQSWNALAVKYGRGKVTMSRSGYGKGDVSEYYSNIRSAQEVLAKVQDLVKDKKLDEARQILESALDDEINHKGNDPNARMTYHTLLRNIAEMQNDWQSSMVHVKMFLQLRKSVKEPPEMTEIIKKDSILARSSIESHDNTSALGFLRILVETANHCFQESEVTVRALLGASFALKGVTIDVPLFRSFIIIRAAKRWYDQDDERKPPVPAGIFLEDLQEALKDSFVYARNLVSGTGKLFAAFERMLHRRFESHIGICTGEEEEGLPLSTTLASLEEVLFSSADMCINGFCSSSYYREREWFQWIHDTGTAYLRMKAADFPTSLLLSVGGRDLRCLGPAGSLIAAGFATESLEDMLYRPG